MIHSGEIYKEQREIIEKIEGDLDHTLRTFFKRPDNGKFVNKVVVSLETRNFTIRRHTKSYDPEMIWERICNRYRENGGWGVSVSSDGDTTFTILLTKAQKWIDDHG